MNRQKQNRGREFQEDIDRITEAFEEAEGDAGAALHRNVVAHTSSQFKSGTPEVDLPTDIAPYLDKLALNAYKITDADIEELQRLGYSDDAIFELTIGGALGVGLAAWQSGNQAIETFFDATNLEGPKGSREESTKESAGESEAAKGKEYTEPIHAT